MTTRRVARHVVIGGSTLAAGALLYVVIPSPNVARKLTLATAYPGLALLAATLGLGPWYVLRGRRPPVSMASRRDLGIWAGVIAVAHTLVGLRVHFQGDWRRYFIYPPGDAHGVPLRADPIGWANHTGAVAMLLLTVLVALSNDAALRRLGPPRWKALQRANYVIFGLVAVHGFLYQALTRRAVSAVALMITLVCAAVLIQALGFRARRAALRRASGEDPLTR